MRPPAGRAAAKWPPDSVVSSSILEKRDSGSGAIPISVVSGAADGVSSTSKVSASPSRRSAMAIWSESAP